MKAILQSRDHYCKCQTTLLTLAKSVKIDEVYNMCTYTFIHTPPPLPPLKALASKLSGSLDSSTNVCKMDESNTLSPGQSSVTLKMAVGLALGGDNVVNKLNVSIDWVGPSPAVTTHCHSNHGAAPSKGLRRLLIALCGLQFH